MVFGDTSISVDEVLSPRFFIVSSQLCGLFSQQREFGIIILCNKPAFINDVNIE